MVAGSFRDGFSMTSAISLQLVQLSASAARLFVCAQPSRRHHEWKDFLPSLPETRSPMLYNFLGGRTSPRTPWLDAVDAEATEPRSSRVIHVKAASRKILSDSTLDLRSHEFSLTYSRTLMPCLDP